MLSFTVKKQNKKEKNSAVKTWYLPQEDYAYDSFVKRQCPNPYYQIFSSLIRSGRQWLYYDSIPIGFQYSIP